MKVAAISESRLATLSMPDTTALLVISTSGALMLESAIELARLPIVLKTASSSFTMPSFRPSIMKPPMDLKTFDGDAMPSVLLTLFTRLLNLLTTRLLKSLQSPVIPPSVPLVIPSPTPLQSTCFASSRVPVNQPITVFLMFCHAVSAVDFTPSHVLERNSVVLVHAVSAPDFMLSHVSEMVCLTLSHVSVARLERSSHTPETVPLMPSQISDADPCKPVHTSEIVALTSFHFSVAASFRLFHVSEIVVLTLLHTSVAVPFRSFHTLETVVLMSFHFSLAASFKLFHASETVVLMPSHVSDALLESPSQMPETVSLIPSHAVEAAPLMSSHRPLKNPAKSATIPSTQSRMAFQPSVSPPSRPSMMKPPCSFITVEGEAMPNAALKPSMKGLKMLS